MSATVSRTSASDRAAQTTFAPSRANTWLITRPMPLLAPVMIATRFAKRDTRYTPCSLSFVVRRSSWLSDDPCVAQPRDLLGTQSEPSRKHFVGVLPEQRRWCSNASWRFRHPHGRPGHPDAAGDRMIAFHERPPRGHLWMLDDRLHRVDG